MFGYRYKGIDGKKKSKLLTIIDEIPRDNALRLLVYSHLKKYQTLEFGMHKS